jgi:hypothetical protein
VAAAHPDDTAGVTAWFETLAAHVREVDFTGARPIFAPDMVAFGTFTDFMTGRDAAEQQQWRKVWPHIDGFRWRPDIRAIVCRIGCRQSAWASSIPPAMPGRHILRPARPRHCGIRAR